MDSEENPIDNSKVVPKRKYQKRKTESKISVRHYLNNRVTIYKSDAEEKYMHPLYVQVIYKGKTNNFKSFLYITSTLENFDKLKTDHKLELESEILFFTEQIHNAGNLLGNSRFTVELNHWDMTDIVDKIRRFIGNKIAEIFYSNIEELELKIEQKKNDKDYQKILDDMIIISEGIDFHSHNYDRLFPALERLFFNNEGIKKLKSDFLLKPDFIDLLFNNTHLHTTQNTVIGWEAGLTQMYIRSCYRGTEYEQLCETYIARIENLLAQKSLDTIYFTV